MKPVAAALSVLVLVSAGCQSADQVSPHRYQTRTTIDPVESNPDQYIITVQVERLSPSGEVAETLARPIVLVNEGQRAEMAAGQRLIDEHGTEWFDGVTTDVLVSRTDTQRTADIATTIKDKNRIVWSSQSSLAISQ